VFDAKEEKRFAAHRTYGMPPKERRGVFHDSGRVVGNSVAMFLFPIGPSSTKWKISYQIALHFATLGNLSWGEPLTNRI
jgi:hypothetical protein